ncbi:MAG: hypothetical protein I8H66_09560 [Sphingobacteriia bacterium]|nr:hypothetical protein [Sphingobacteriia bacterium]
MKYSQQIGMMLALAVIGVCWMPWVVIESKAILVDGFHTTGTNFGRPGLFLSYASGMAFVLFILNRIWAKRTNVFITTFAFAWSVRNYLILSACYGGECPQKQPGLYLEVALTAMMLLMSLLPKMDIKNK